MKKIAILTAILLFSSSAAFAAGSITMSSTLSATNTGKTIYASKTTAVAGTGLVAKTSSGVGVGLMTNAQGYSVCTQHTNGMKAYGTSYDSTSIFSHDVTTKGTAYLTVPTAITTANFVTWTSM